MIKRVFSCDIIFDPFHPDKFGGVANTGRFIVRIVLIFSSGALVFPLVWELIRETTGTAIFLNILVYCLTGVFLLTLIACFFIPVYQIKRFVDPKKQRILLDSRSELERMIIEFKENENLDIKQIVEIFMYYNFNHAKLSEMKDYPWDLRVLIEFGLSFIIPIGITVLKLVL